MERIRNTTTEPIDKDGSSVRSYRHEVKTTIRLAPDLHKRAKMAAADRLIPLEALMTEALIVYLGDRKTGTGLAIDLTAPERRMVEKFVELIRSPNDLGRDLADVIYRRIRQFLQIANADPIGVSIASRAENPREKG